MHCGFRKAYCLPLSPRLLTASYRVAGGSTSVRSFQTPGCSGPLRGYVPRSVLVNLLAGFAFPSLLLLAGASSPCSKRAKHCTLGRRKLNTEQPFSYCYEFTNSASLGKRRYVHTAADLHVRPWFSNRAGLESLGRREPFRDTLCTGTRNPRVDTGERLFRHCCKTAIARVEASF